MRMQHGITHAEDSTSQALSSSKTGKPFTSVSTCTRSTAAAVAKQQSSLSVKILGWAAAAHGPDRARTGLEKLKSPLFAFTGQTSSSSSASASTSTSAATATATSSNSAATTATGSSTATTGPSMQRDSRISR
ncbi:hypothetical protein K457DRAFT_1825567 [Linnemannia elongata AG-77]|uniref:Uncharacterized protein n=1 Tax=Linnemannia elongata AG-77 TaxID=1314771 RepID=A0A197JB44_9FUNG|nr:hypothetical protein K457DRAFT_1825567 [Linnemannia elongata AG-77]